MSKIKKIMVYIALVTMSISGVGCASKNESASFISDLKENEVIARVNGQAIYQNDYDELYQEYYRYFGETEEAAEYLKSQKQILLEELVNTEVLIQKAEKLGITCTDEEAEDALNNIKEQYGEEVFNQMLDYAELTKEDYLRQIKKQLVLMELQAGMIADDIEVTDEEVTAYYEKNKVKLSEKIMSLEEVKDEITEMVEEEKQYALYQEQLKKWVLEAKIETYEDRIQS